MPKKSDVPLKADGVPFRFVVMVEGKQDQPTTCLECNGEGSVGGGWYDGRDPEEVCPSCRGSRTKNYLNVWDDELEQHLKECMDDYLREKYCDAPVKS